MPEFCGECRQTLSKDRYDAGVCEKCEKASRADELAERVEELEELVSDPRERGGGNPHIRDESDYSSMRSAILSYLRMGLSKSQAVDYYFVHDEGMSKSAWAEKQGLTPAAVYNSLRDVEPVVESQTTLEDHDDYYSPEPDEDDAEEMEASTQ